MKRYDMHFEGIDGRFTIRSQFPTTRRGALNLALELARVRIRCSVRGVTPVEV